MWRKASRTINDRPANRQRDTVVHWFAVAGAIAACGVAGTSGALGRMVQLLLRHQDRRKLRRLFYNVQFANHQDEGGKDYRQH
jgi:hypothetical protein